MSNPLIERRDYGGCDQIEKNMVELKNNGVLSDDFYNKNKDRIDKCADEENMEFITEINASNEDYKPTIAIDFDGVLHLDINKDHSISGKVISGAKQAIDKLKEKYKIVIFSARVSSEFNINKGIKDISEFLDSQHIHYDDISICKPVAEYYIDDRAVHFSTWDDTLHQLELRQAAGPLTRRRRDSLDATHTNHDPSIDEQTFYNNYPEEYRPDEARYENIAPEYENLWSN